MADAGTGLRRKSAELDGCMRMRQGTITERTGLPIDEIVDESFGEYVRQTIGRVRSS